MIQEFGISSQNVKYLASLAEHYSISSLQSMPRDFSAVILCCYLHFRFHRSNDILTDAFLRYISRLKDAAQEHAKSEVYRQRQDITANSLGIADLLDFFVDDKVADSETFGEVRKRAHAIVKPDEIKRFSQFLRENFTDVGSLKWAFYAKKNRAFKKSLRPLVSALDFYSTKGNDALVKAVEHLKNCIANKAPIISLQGHTPKAFIPNRLKHYVRVGKDMDSDRYEFMVYDQVATRIASRELAVRNSVNYLSFEEDLISKKQWDERATFLASTPFTRLSSEPKKLLQALEKALEEKVKTVNHNLAQGLNKEIKVKDAQGEL